MWDDCDCEDAGAYLLSMDSSGNMFVGPCLSCFFEYRDLSRASTPELPEPMETAELPETPETAEMAELPER